MILDSNNNILDRAREELQDDIDKHRFGKENELRRKEGLPEIPYYLKDLRTPEEIKINKDFKNKCADEAVRKTEQFMIAQYLHKLNKENKNE